MVVDRENPAVRRIPFSRALPTLSVCGEKASARCGTTVRHRSPGRRVRATGAARRCRSVNRHTPSACQPGGTRFAISGAPEIRAVGDGAALLPREAHARSGQSTMKPAVSSARHRTTKSACERRSHDHGAPTGRCARLLRSCPCTWSFVVRLCERSLHACASLADVRNADDGRTRSGDCENPDVCRRATGRRLRAAHGGCSSKLATAAQTEPHRCD